MLCFCLHLGGLRPRIALLALLLPCLGLATPVSWAGELRWTGGAVTSDWFDEANWDTGVVPGVGDVVWIGGETPPAVEINGGEAACSGVVLGEGATLEIDGFDALHIIGAGDLDMDGVPDLEEWEESLPYDLDLDVDMDGVPNYADNDSDGDGMSDACEFGYKSVWSANPGLHPYVAATDPDIDGDEFSNAEECEAGSDVLDDQSVPENIPAYGMISLVLLAVIFLFAGLYVLRNNKTLAIYCLFFFLGLSLFTLATSHFFPAVYAATFSVDFALGDTLQGKAASATGDDTLEINGASDRPWNGASTYVMRSIPNPTSTLTLEAVGGAVFLGGMRTSLQLGIVGQGTVRAQSVFSHIFEIDATVEAGVQAVNVFLGERLELTPVGADSWGFYEWSLDATGSDDPLAFQAATHGRAVSAVFSPPGPDLLALWDSGIPTDIKAGEGFSLDMVVRNIGSEAINQAVWADGIYLSRDAVVDGFDYKLGGDDSQTDLLISNASYTQSLSGNFPDVAPGQYFLLGVADIFTEVEEDNENNNSAAAATAVLNVHLAQ